MVLTIIVVQVQVVMVCVAQVMVCVAQVMVCAVVALVCAPLLGQYVVVRCDIYLVSQIVSFYGLCLMVFAQLPLSVHHINAVLFAGVLLSIASTVMALRVRALAPSLVG